MTKVVFRLKKKHWRRDVVQAVMRSRLSNLQSELRTLKRHRPAPTSASATAARDDDDAADRDEWSSDGDDASPSDGTELLRGEMVETERERMIRLGLITPFDALNGLDRQVCVK